MSVNEAKNQFKSYKKIGVVGSRNFTDTRLLKEILSDYQPTVIISGGAKGADSIARQYAVDNKIEYVEYRPNWKHHGKSAGAIRNKIIVQDSDLIIAFWDSVSKGTKITIDYAREIDVPLHIVYFTPNSPESIYQIKPKGILKSVTEGENGEEIINYEN